MKKRPLAKALLVPGYGGSSQSPLLLRVQRALAALSIESCAVSLERRRPLPRLEHEVAQLRKAREDFIGNSTVPWVVVGRSFGGRVGAFLALQTPPRALVVLSHPIRPEGRVRTHDEEALGKLACPTLLIQGDGDEKAPLPVLLPLVRQNPFLELKVLEGARHALGRHEGPAIEYLCVWLRNLLQRG